MKKIVRLNREEILDYIVQAMCFAHDMGYDNCARHRSRKRSMEIFNEFIEECFNTESKKVNEYEQED